MSDDENEFVLLSCTPKQYKKIKLEIYPIKEKIEIKEIKKEDFNIKQQQFLENYIQIIKVLYKR